MQFTFPLEKIGPVSSLSEVKILLNKQLEEENLRPYCTYRFQLIRKQYIYCRCRDCPARLAFRKVSSGFELFKSSTSHQHRKNSAKKYVIIQAIKNYPSCFSIGSIKQMTLNRFNISPATFYRYFRQSRSFGKTIDNVLVALESEGVFGVKIESEMGLDSELPSILLLTSELMISKYHQNNKNVKFDLTYNLIRDQTSENKQYAVGAFVTLNSNMNIEPVCLVIVAEETTKSFVRVFNQFFILMRSSPNIIMSDEQNTIKLALEQLRQRGFWTGYHLLDMFHVLKNAKKALENKSNINHLIELSRSSDISEYRRKRLNCLNNLSERDKRVLDRLEEKLKSCCIALIPPVFVGLSCSTNSCQKLNDLMKEKIPYSQKYLSVVGDLIRLFTNMTKNKRPAKIQKVKLEDFTVFQQIKQLRFKLSKKVFQRLMLQFSSNMTCLINLCDEPNTYEVQEQDCSEEEEKFVVAFNDQDGRWECECQLTEKIGIPCCHIIKVMVLVRQKLITGIHSWWLLQEIEQQKQKASISFRRKTRRRIG